MKDLKYYIDCFSSLNTAKRLGRPAPHKALLLLSIIDLIERGQLLNNHIILSDTLISTFNANSLKFYASSPFFKPNISYPFFHMGHEPFWNLREAKEITAISQVAENDAKYIRKFPSYSIKKLRQKYSYAEIDKELLELLQEQDNRAKLRVLLISIYLNNRIDLYQTPIGSFPIFITIISTLAC